MIYTFWWFGGFRFGVHRSVHPGGRALVFDMGPLSIVLRFKERARK
jgi:hypothetical protein